jgi:hypothetical protein
MFYNSIYSMTPLRHRFSHLELPMLVSMAALSACIVKAKPPPDFSDNAQNPSQLTLGAASEINWARTSLIIINGDTELRHRQNASMAAEAGIKRGASAVYVSGLAEKKTASVKTTRAESGQLRQMLSEAGAATEAGDTVFLYVTGHGGKEAFIMEGGAELPHKELLALLEKEFAGRKLVFASDACFSANFVNLLSESRSFSAVTAMSPGVTDEKTSCTYFSAPFWHAVQEGLDLDGNRVKTL